MTKVSITQDEFAASVKEHAAKLQPMGLAGATEAADTSSIIEGGLCGILNQFKPAIKEALLKQGFIGSLAWGVLNDLVFKQLCPKT